MVVAVSGAVVECVKIDNAKEGLLEVPLASSLICWNLKENQMKLVLPKIFN